MEAGGSSSRAPRHASSSRPYYVAPSPEDFIISSTPAGVSNRSSTAATSSLSGTSSNNSSSSSSSPTSGLPLPARYATVHDLADDVDLDGPPRTIPALVRYWASATVLGYASTACVMPFEVGKILLQIQWIPKADVQILNEDSEVEEGDSGAEDVIYDVEELSDEDDAQAYFHDLNNSTHSYDRPHTSSNKSRRRQRPQHQPSYARRTRRRGTGRSSPGSDNDEAPTSATGNKHPLRPSLGAPSLSVTAVRDSSGYIIRRSIFETSTKPEWILPFTVTGGVWEMMKSIGRWKGEGWWSLWKGQLTTMVIDVLSNAMQPFLYSCLAAILLRNSPFSTLPLVHIPQPLKPFAITVLSHVVTGYILSPLDLVRTRLVAQSSQSRHKKYSGPIDALNQIREEEGGLRTTYLHSALWVPAILDATFRSFFHLGVPLFIERRLKLTPDTNTIIYGLAEFTLSTCSLIFTLPIETVRRRLQVQSRSQVTGHVAGKKTYKTCVETRPTPYYGVVEATYRILTEETGKLHIYNVEQKPRRPSMGSRRSSNVSNAGGAGGGNSRRTSHQGTAPGGERSSQANLSADNIIQVPDESEVLASSAPLPFYTGLTQLYRGFSMSLTANLIVLVLGLVAGQEGGDTGWTEL